MRESRGEPSSPMDLFPLVSRSGDYDEMKRILLIAVVLLMSAPASAAEPADYSGRFEPVDLTKATEDKENAIKEVASHAPRLFQRIMRSRLSKAASIARFLSFVSSENQMSVSSNESSDWVTDLSATETEFISSWGKKVTMARWMSDGVLFTRAQGERGTRSARLELSSDGLQLSVQTTIENKSLPRPLVFQTEYRRVEPK